MSATTPLETSNKGLAMHMKFGIEYDNETLIMELLDNSARSIGNKPDNGKEDYIEIFNGEDFLFVKDTGAGITDEKLYNIALRNFGIDQVEDIGMNKSGIGMKYVFNNLMQDNHIAFIFSKANNGEDHSMAALTKRNGVTEYIANMRLAATKKSIRELMDENIEQDGFIILIINEARFSEELSLPNYMELLKEYITYTQNQEKLQPNDDLKDKIQTLFRDDVRDYKIKLNNEAINYINHINESDELIFQVELCKHQDKGNRPHIYIKYDTDEKLPRYKYTKRDYDVQEDCKYSENKARDENILAKISVYKSGDSIPDGSFINYRMKNERNQCKCKPSKCADYQSKTMNYLKIDCEFIDREYAREKILKSVKTSTNHNTYEPCDDLKRMNIVITKMCVNKTILDLFGWTLVKWNKQAQSISDKGNMYHITKEQAIESDTIDHTDEVDEKDEVD